MAERQFGPYRLVRQIAVGGMAEIHLAKTKGIAGFEKYVALKMIHPNFAEDEQFIEMLVDEAKIAVQLTHGNIAQTFDLGRVGETYYITMEYVDGADLYKILRRGSEQDLEIPLDVAAYIAKEVASALDYAHRKRDHTGRPLGIVHRDVSPQNVLIAYSGEVKLVDFGIAKATMKARQTAVGVIKGKYYYMSPEQAWGESIDHRSDIFSTGIVLYEMITGQMLYLEEDLHRLLDMARKADIAPPSRLRKGVPPQLEKIVMNALRRDPAERYQSAGDLAADLERFLHTYSPVFTAAKVSKLIRTVLGEPQQLAPEELPEVEIHDGPNATFTLDTNDLVHERGEIHDENSVIFRVSDLKKPAAPKPPVLPRSPGQHTRTHAPTEPPPDGRPTLPVLPKPQGKRAGAPPRRPDEDTRELLSAPPGPNDETSGLLTTQGDKVASPWHGSGDDDDLENIGERTVITGMPGGGSFMMDADNNIDGPDATMVSSGPPSPEPASADDVGDDAGDDGDSDDEEGPTLSRDFRTDRPRARTPRPPRTPPPAALAAKIHAPAVSELRKPRPSKRTPQGVPAQGNVLQQIVGKQPSEPMPAPRPQASPPPASPPPPSGPPPMQGPQFSNAAPAASPAVSYANDASGLPLGIPTPPSGVQAAQYPYPQQGYPPQGYPPGYPQQGQGYPPQPGYPGAQGHAGYAGPPVSPGSLYQLQPTPQPMTLTGQLRLAEVDELPSQYKLSSTSRRLFAYAAAALAVVTIAAGVTFFIIRATRHASPKTGTVYIESTPPGAEVVFNGTRMIDKTPLSIPGVPVGSRHDLRIELARHVPYTSTVDVPKGGGEVRVTAVLAPVTGKLIINSQPGGAEIYINGEVRGRTPTTLTDIDMDSARRIELRLKDYQPFVQELTWPSNGQITIDAKLER